MTKKTFLVTGARAPVALHLTRLLSEAGHRVHLADSLSRPLAGFSNHATACHLLPSPRFAPEAFADALGALIRRHSVDLVIPTCEEVFHLAQIAPRLPCPLFAPDAAHLEEAHHKGRFIARCAAAGLPVPETFELTSPDDLQRFAPKARALVFKPAWSRFGAQVLRGPHPEALAELRPSPSAPWIAQDYLRGTEISLYAVAVGGELRALAAYRALARAGQGAAIAFAPVESAAIRAFARRYIEATGWHGQISFDLMQLPCGAVQPLECNPRATSGLHFFTRAAAFAQALYAAGTPVAPDVTEALGVKLALRLYGGRAKIRDLHHWPGDRIGTLTQLRGLWPIARQALRHRISLQAAATRDIEWNGPAAEDRRA